MDSSARVVSGRRLLPGHRHFVELFHLFPRGRHGAFLPAPVSTDRGASEIDPAVRFAEGGESIGSAEATSSAAASSGAASSSTAATASKRPQAVRNLLPEGA